MLSFLSCLLHRKLSVTFEAHEIMGKRYEIEMHHFVSTRETDLILRHVEDAPSADRTELRGDGCRRMPETANKNSELTFGRTTGVARRP